jgi:hypothetical protein
LVVLAAVAVEVEVAAVAAVAAVVEVEVEVAAVSVPKSQFVLKPAPSLLRNIELMKFELEVELSDVVDRIVV